MGRGGEAKWVVCCCTLGIAPTITPGYMYMNERISKYTSRHAWTRTYTCRQTHALYPSHPRAQAVYNNATGELVCAEKPVYGGTGQIDLPKFDEPGYIAIPPCLWGDHPALEPMPRASGVTFLIKAITNST